MEPCKGLPNWGRRDKIKTKTKIKKSFTLTKLQRGGITSLRFFFYIKFITIHSNLTATEDPRDSASPTHFHRLIPHHNPSQLERLAWWWQNPLHTTCSVKGTIWSALPTGTAKLRKGVTRKRPLSVHQESRLGGREMLIYKSEVELGWGGAARRFDHARHKLQRHRSKAWHPLRATKKAI